MRKYNPFEKSRTLSNLEMLYTTEYINGRKFNVGRLSLDRKIDFDEIMFGLKKINPFFGLTTIMSKSVSNPDPVGNMNKMYHKFCLSMMDAYIIDFPTTAVVKVFTDKGKPKKEIFKDVPRYLTIYLRSKTSPMKNTTSFFRNNKTTSIEDDLDEAIKILNDAKKECVKLLTKNKVNKISGQYNINNLFGSYYNNINDLKNIVKDYKSKDLLIDFDIITTTIDVRDMVIGTLDFLFKRKWVTYRPEKKMKKKKNTLKKS